jgi:small subunit ribosomal protein S2
MKDISLKDLLEAGCHFGHRVERWHPKAAKFIYQAREKIYIIDLVKTREYLQKSAEYVKDLARQGKTVLFIATKRQAKGVVREAAKRVGIPYITNRWIGGLITNWDEVKKNIDKLNRMRTEKVDGIWKKFPKHEIVKLEKALRRVESVYEGVDQLKDPPEAIFLVDIKKEIICLREAWHHGIKVVAIVDTNSNPEDIDYPIPANDDAVGSIQLIVNYLVEAYLEGVKLKEKGSLRLASLAQGKLAKENKNDSFDKTQSHPERSRTDEEIKEKKKIDEEEPKRRGRPKKS